MTKDVRFSITISKQDDTRLNQARIDKRLSKQVMIRIAIDEYLKKHEKEGR